MPLRDMKRPIRRHRVQPCTYGISLSLKIEEFCVDYKIKKQHSYSYVYIKFSE